MPECGFCNMAKEYLQNRGIEFVDYDISRDGKKAEEMVRKSGKTGVPVLEINGRIVVGFNPQLIEDALKKKEPPKREEFINNTIFDPFGN
ncbi:glutathione S-transferase N-terminal domain-containing protein [Candidatus Micrarchaeota archaeon]|nr:glutathione S-transferase N-terminal domain-containing protein [Candidatus Micrarchaeota archaeon]